MSGDPFARIFGGNPPPQQPSKSSDSNPFARIFEQPQYREREEGEKRQLPPGAVDFLPNGKAYYGPGMDGYFNGVKARMSEQSFRKNADGSYSPAKTTGLQMAGRGLKEGVFGVLEGLNQLSEGYQSTLAVQNTLNKLADESRSYLPDPSKGEAERSWAYNIPIVSMVDQIYNTARIMTGARKFSWEEIKKTFDTEETIRSKLGGTIKAQKILAGIENTAAGKKLKSWQYGKNLFEANLRGEFLRRAQAGENPDYVVADLANPIAEFGQDLIEDPTNLLGGFVDDAIKAAKLLANAQKPLQTLDNLKDGWKAISAVENVADEIPIAARMAQDIVAHNTEQAAKLVNTSDLINPFRLNSRGKADQFADISDNVFKDFTSAFKSSPGQLQEALTGLALVGSKNAEEVQTGLQMFKRLGSSKYGELATSEDGLKTAQFLNRILTDENGEMTGKFVEDIISRANKGGTLEEVLEKWESKSNAVLYEMFPSVIDMAKQPEKYKVPAWALNTAKMQDTIQNKFKVAGMNKFLSTMYITTNPGAGFRNLLNNVFTAAVDFGPKTGGEAIGGFVEKVVGREADDLQKIKDLLGFSTRAATRGLKGGAGGGAVEGGVNIIKAIGELTDKGERATSVALFYNSAKRTMDKVMREGVGIASAKELRDLGIPLDQVEYLVSLTQKNNGNTGAAISKWMGEASKGVLETFRNMRSVLSKSDILMAQNTHGMSEAIQKVLEAGTKDEALKAIADIRKGWDDVAKKTDGMLPSYIDANTEEAQTVAQAVANGLNKKDADLFFVKLTAQRKATDLLNSAARKTVSNLINDLAKVNDGARIILVNAIRDGMDDTMKRILDASKHDEFLKSVKKIVLNKHDEGMMLNQASLLDGFEDYYKTFGRGSGKVRDDIWNFYIDKRQRLHNAEIVNYLDEWKKLLGPDGEIAGVMQDGVNYLDSPLMKNAMQEFDELMRVREATGIVNGKLVKQGGQAIELTKNSDKIRKLASESYGIASATETGASTGNKLLNIINANLPEGMAKIKNLDEVSEDVAKQALESHKLKGGAAEAGQATNAAQSAGVVQDGVGAAEAAGKATAKTGSEAHTITRAQWDTPKTERDTLYINLSDKEGGQVLEVYKNPSSKDYAEMRKKYIKEYGTPTGDDPITRSTTDEFNNTYSWMAGDSLHDIAEPAIAKKIGGDVEQGMSHYQLVKKALQDGKDVPNNVLDDYQTLKKFYSKAATAVKEVTEEIPIPLFDGMMPSSGQAARPQMAGVNALLDRLTAGIESTWGKGSAISGITPEQMAALKRWSSETDGRMFEARAVASKFAQQERDFALLNYGQKTSMDHALAYIFPYQFWYSRSYRNWMERLVRHPEVISRYAQYKEWLGEQHATLPEWWKNTVSVNDLPGVNVENPMYMNLEATLNPLNGITGIDFDDKNKVIGEPGTFENFWTSTINDIGKFGPSPHTALSLATAFYLMNKGEQDAAQRWAGRFVPQSLTVKSLASKAGIQLETDPMVMLMSGKGFKSFDAYEARRIGRQLADMSNEKLITPEEATEAARAHSGEIWDQAALRATQVRAGGQIAGQLFGVGFKQRSNSDMEIDKFYEAYNNLWSSADDLTPQEFKIQMDSVRERYPFMDAVLLTKKGGWERDRAYAYSVMGRISPGDTSAITKASGLPADILDKFYNEKGNIGAWKEDDRMKFMGAMNSIGTTLAIPSTATQQQWTMARNAYSLMNEAVKQNFGTDIDDKMTVYYELKTMEEKETYLRDHPEVQGAMDYKSYVVANSPILAGYYDGLRNIEGYYQGEMKRDVLNKLGADYFEILKARQGIFDPKELAAFDRQYNLKASQKEYTALTKKWNEYIERKILEYGATLPQGIPSQQQELTGPLSTGQENIISAITPQQQVQWQEIEGRIPDSLRIAIGRYIVDQKPFTTANKSMLARVAKYIGLTSEEILQAAYNFQ